MLGLGLDIPDVSVGGVAADEEVPSNVVTLDNGDPVVLTGANEYVVTG